MNFFSDKTPAGRRKRLLAAGGGALVLAVIVLANRGGGNASRDPEDASATASGAADIAGAGGQGIPSTFADNGAAMGQLTDVVQGSVLGLQGSVDTLASNQAALYESLGDLNTTTQALSDSIQATAAPAALAASGTPTKATSTAAKRKNAKAADPKPSRRASSGRLRTGGKDGARGGGGARRPGRKGKSKRAATPNRTQRSPSRPPAGRSQPVRKSPHRKR